MGEIPFVDESIEDEAYEKAKMMVIKNVRQNWDPSLVKLKIFEDGISNKLYGFYVGDSMDSSTVLVRIYGHKTDLMIDRDAEIRNMRLLHENGCASQLYFLFRNGISYQFIPGQTTTIDSIRTEKISRLVAKEMTRLHAISLSTISNDGEGTVKPEIWSRLNRFVSLLPDKFDDADKDKLYRSIVPSKESFFAEADLLKNSIDVLNRPVVLCHNDILLANIIINDAEDRAMFIDYEYGFPNYDAHDLGNHFNEWAGVDPPVDYTKYPSAETQRNWIKIYLEYAGRPADERSVEDLYRAAQKCSLVSNLFWGCWAVIQAYHSTIDFDFLGYAKARLGRYFETKDAFLAL